MLNPGVAPPGGLRPGLAQGSSWGPCRPGAQLPRHLPAHAPWLQPVLSHPLAAISPWLQSPSPA